MRTKLLYLLFIVPFISFGQTIESETFDGLSIGSISGQGTWQSQIGNGDGSTTNMTEANLAVTTGGVASTNGFTITGPNGDSGSAFIWNDGFAGAWASRTLGNDIVEVEVSVNPGAVGGTSKNTFGVYIYNADYTKVLAGFIVDAETNTLSVIAYSLPTGELSPNNFTYGLAAAPGLALASNTWSKVGVSYNTVTGEVLIDSDAITDGPLGLPTNVAVDTPAEVDFVVTSGSSTVGGANTASTTMIFDNYEARATASNTLLNTEEFELNSVGLYPNPAKESITLASDTSIKNVEIFNSLGQVVLTKNSDFSNTNVFDISNLTSGVYIMTINSTDGASQTKKFIKE
ncbi:T9SS type A sorting domain-containing protein [Winogradskyella sediminis]|uniref:T9SS type A sorting domain-containing protein n=1 Tax=Winogradskyella sediminis TaxID=1382466 RepID=UPI003AA81613